MDPALEKLVADRDEAGIERAFFEGGCKNLIAVDWRDEDDEIVSSCATCLNLPDLASRFEGRDLVITYAGRERRVSLKQDVGDRHLTICGINDAIAPGHELRFLVCSHGSDTIGLAALSTADWRSLEDRFPEAVSENFLDPRTLPNIINDLIDDHLPPEARARFDRMLARNSRKQ
ncbi:MAG: hypothetical protein ACO1TE_27540 [Prosthecobacter sp.]